jgi:hypothetical protein
MLELETDHRQHAMVENAIRDLKYGLALKHMPSGKFGANGIWLALNVMAHNLCRWLGRLPRPPQHPQPSLPLAGPRSRVTSTGGQVNESTRIIEESRENVGAVLTLARRPATSLPTVPREGCLACRYHGADGPALAYRSLVEGVSCSYASRAASVGQPSATETAAAPIRQHATSGCSRPPPRAPGRP